MMKLLKSRAPGHYGVKADYNDYFSHKYENAARWLVSSFQRNNSEGSSAWKSRLYHPFRAWSRAYPETSGYIIPTLYDYVQFRESEQKTKDIHQIIEKTVTWLLSIQMPSGSFPAGHYVGNNHYYLQSRDYFLRRTHEATESSFNSGQILLGLVRHFQETGDQRCLVAINRCADFLGSSIQPDGVWTKDSYANASSPSYFTHVSWPLLEAWRVTKNHSHKTKAILSLDRVMTKVDRRTSFISNMGFRGSDSASTHTIGYCLFGLLQSSRMLAPEGSTYEKAAVSALDRLFRISEVAKKMPGGFSSGWKPDWAYTCVTGDMQLALCFLVLFDSSGDLRFLNSACRLYSRIADAQEVDGSFYGSIPPWGKYMAFRKPSWVVKYFLDATLHLWRSLELEKATEL